MSKSDDNIVGWFSLKGGKRIPIHEGESKSDAVKKALGGQSETPKTKSVTQTNEDKKQEQISKAQAEAKRLNDEQRYQDELKKGNAVTIAKNGDMMFKGKAVQPLDTTDATEPNAKYPNGDSLYQSLDKNGNLTEERQELHRQLIEDYFKDHKPFAPGEEKVAYFTGGGGASGKGAFSKVDAEKGINGIAQYYSRDTNPIVIDPDAIKGKLSAADGIDPKQFNAGFYHEESSALAKQIYSTAIQHGFPVMYDGTATNPDSILARVGQARDGGYKTEMNFVRADVKTIVANSIARYVKGQEVKNADGSKSVIHRLVPTSQLLKAHQNAPSAVGQISKSFDKFTLWDNSGRNMTKIASRAGRGTSLTVHNRKAWQSFVNQRSSFTWTKKEEQQYEADAKKALADSQKKK